MHFLHSISVLLELASEAWFLQGLLVVCNKVLSGPRPLRCRAREPLLAIGLPARHFACRCNRSDQLR